MVSRILSLSFAVFFFFVGGDCALSQTARQVHPEGGANIWVHENLYVWEVVDSLKRGPEERAQMLERLGFKQYAYFSGSKRVTAEIHHDFNDIHGDADAQVAALQRHGIDIVAWFLWTGADDPQVRTTFELFKRHNIHPQIWISQAHAWVAPYGFGTLHKPREIPVLPKDSSQLSSEQGNELIRMIFELNEEELPKTDRAQRRRVVQEAERIKALANLAGQYGCMVALYNHEGRWFGNVENELGVVTYLKGRGTQNVGLVYNFSHAISRDQRGAGKDYDDTHHFPELWAKLMPHVVAVNITAVGGNGANLSEGKSELEMMRTIQSSGWQGPIGLEVHHSGDAAVILRNNLEALDRIAAELRQAGSARSGSVLTGK